ncbi:MAG TPA: alpha/beta hydrolase [Allosphingosinicella sp.]
MQVAEVEIAGFIGRAQRRDEDTPSVLLLPGLDNSGPGHWQSQWELLPYFRRVDFGDWATPRLHEWVPNLDRAVRESPRPLVLVAHSLGCLAATWWATLSWSEAFREKVLGALLVAPPDVDAEDTPCRIRDFRPLPPRPLPFPSLLIASRNDPYASFARSAHMARLWGSELIDAGKAGHINADSSVGEWREGLHYLARLGGQNANFLVAELRLRSFMA